MTHRIIVEESFPIALVPKGRPRVGGGRAYTPARTRDAEEELGFLMRRSRKFCADGPVAVSLDFRGKRGNADLDNLVKLVLDAGNGILWKDDHQIVKLLATWVTAETPSVWVLATETD